MFSLYGIAGRVFNGPLDQLPRVRRVDGKPRVEALQDTEADFQVSLAWAAAGGIDGRRPASHHGAGGSPGAGGGAEGLTGSTTGPAAGPTSGPNTGPFAGPMGAYRAAAQAPRGRLRTVGELMSRPALTLDEALSAREAWQALAERRVAQAPVLGEGGRLVGLAGRRELSPGPEVVDLAAHWQQPVGRLMRTPVPAVGAEAGLRDVAQALLVTGLPGLPVVDDAGAVLGFLSRTDLLRGVAQDPPLDLWA